MILAHADEAMLRRLVTRLAPLGPVYVHLDAKTDVAGWGVGTMACQFIEPRVAVYWGDWSMVEATTSLLESALTNDLNQRFTFITGSHFPIISNDDMDQRSTGDANFIASRRAPNMPDGSRPEIDYERRFYRTKRANGPWSKLKNGAMNRILYYRRPLNWRDVSPDTGMRAGESYWSINRSFAQFCVDQIRSSDKLIEYFQRIVCSDEKVFATLYGEFAGEYTGEGTTYSKWAGGANPISLTRDDITSARTVKEFWFARKFSSAQSEFLDWIEST